MSHTSTKLNLFNSFYITCKKCGSREIKLDFESINKDGFLQLKCTNKNCNNTSIDIK